MRNHQDNIRDVIINTGSGDAVQCLVRCSLRKIRVSVPLICVIKHLVLVEPLEFITHTYYSAQTSIPKASLDLYLEYTCILLMFLFSASSPRAPSLT